MTLPIVERARERLAGKTDLLALVDDAVVARFELMPGEIKVLAALLLADGGLLEAAALAGTSSASFQAAFGNLQARGLVSVVKGQVSLDGMAQQLKVEADAEAAREENIPAPVIVLRSLPEQVAALARSSNNGAAALGRVYAFLFGKRATDYALLGRYVKEFGGATKAARFLLEHALDELQGQEPLLALLGLAVATGNAYRNHGWPRETDPDQEAIRRGRVAEVDWAWQTRMKRWLNEGSLEHNLANIDQAEDSELLSHEQADADRRQAELDFAKWVKEGRPQL